MTKLDIACKIVTIIFYAMLFLRALYEKHKGDKIEGLYYLIYALIIFVTLQKN